MNASIPEPNESAPFPLTTTEKIIGIGSVVGWCVVFNIGNTVGAKPIFSALNSSSSGFATLFWLTAIFFVYTPTNVLILTFAAGLAGTVFGKLEPSIAGTNHLRSPSKLRLWKSVFGSFMIYLIVLSGVLSLLGLPFKMPNPDSIDDVEKSQSAYRVTASFASLFSLIEGARPFVMEAFGDRLQRLLVPHRAAAREGSANEPSQAT